jgi:hypothetical protein
MTTKIIYLNGKAVEVKVYPAIEPKTLTAKSTSKKQYKDRPKYTIRDYTTETITADYILVATFN